MDGRSDGWMEFGAVHTRRKKQKTPLGAFSLVILRGRSRFSFFFFFRYFLFRYIPPGKERKRIRRGMREKPSERGGFKRVVSKKNYLRDTVYGIYGGCEGVCAFLRYSAVSYVMHLSYLYTYIHLNIYIYLYI